MEDSGIVSKKLVIFIGVVLLGILIVGIIYALKEEKEVPIGGETTTNTDKTPDKIPEEIDESFMYGMYVNEADDESYLEITKDGYTYIMNACEEYVTYNSNDFNFTKSITNESGVNTVTVKLTSRNNEVVNMTFVGSSSGLIQQFTGTSTCSDSDKYIRKTLEN